MKEKSFIKQTVYMLVFQIILLVVVLLVFLMSSYHHAGENLSQILENFIQIYGNELENKIENGDRLLERLIYKNTEYDLLLSENESERYYATVRLKELLDDSLINDKNVDMIVIAEQEYQTCIDSEHMTVTPGEKRDIRNFTLKYADEQVKAEWKIEYIGNTPYIYKIYSWHGRAAGVFMKTDSFMETAADSKLDDMTLLLLDRQKKVKSLFGSNVNDYQPGDTIDLSDQSHIGLMHKTYVLEGGNITLLSTIRMSGIRGQLQSGMLIFLMVICFTLFFSIVIIQFIRREILRPMINMQKSMSKIQDGDYQLRIEENYSNEEFTLLKNTFNGLMDEIVGLRFKSYEKQIELQETELKCVKLQIRPHFFLNAITTISSLSMQHKNDQIKTYIDALSKNIRYMFKSGLHTVSLSEEIRHVENYFEMQDLKYPGCVFYYIEIEPGVENWKIPQMLIHTITENEYKYAVSIDEMLTILIKASRVERGGEQMLLIEIEDDGKGYENEILDGINGNSTTLSKNGNRIGLMSIKRMLELMYDQSGLFEISNVVPHGCLNRFYIPIQAVHEIRNDGSKK